MKWLLIILASSIALVTLYFLFIAGKNISYEAQSKYFDNVRTIASIIFGVTGAWLAITYPKALSSASAARQASADERTEALNRATEDSKILIGFVRTMIISIVVIAISLSVPFVKEILALYQWAIDIKEYFRGILYTLLGITSIVQLALLGLTLRNTYLALTELNRETAEAVTRAERDRNREY
ncbi:hypothetical protein ACFQ45_06645 [Rhodanobacter aciditrophus]|uniref:MotA/TolQ/ExbB proton channel domain-containing protein n=1 Tax=Rhodanobacter aciditrophus TaxID=1623218 RepID=A0ABW4B1D1_9GAMM